MYLILAFISYSVDDNGVGVVKFNTSQRCGLGVLRAFEAMIFWFVGRRPTIRPPDLGIF